MADKILKSTMVTPDVLTASLSNGTVIDAKPVNITAERVANGIKFTVTDIKGTTTAQIYDGGASSTTVADVKVNGVSMVEDNVANISVPTKVSEIENDSEFIDKSYHDKTKQNILSSDDKQEIADMHIDSVNSVNSYTGNIILDGSDIYVDDDESEKQTIKDVLNEHSNRISALEEEEELYRYGFRRIKSESSPSSRIEYIYDASGMSPAYMDFNNEKFIWGDWKDFIESFIRPVMLKDDGTVDYELDHDDQTKKVDGTASDIANASYDGSAMVEFGKRFCWVKRYEENGYDYVIFSNKQIDPDYHAYAHIGSDVKIKDAFYWGMFDGINSSSKLRSLCGTPMVSQTREVEISYAKAIGKGWGTIFWSGWNYINDLLTLIGKSDDVQSVFGSGRINSSNTSKINNGTLKDKGCFYGDNEGVNGVKTLWIENHWGNIWQSISGCINENGICKVKNFGDYCAIPVSAPDYNSYTVVGGLPASGYYVDSYVDKNGTIPKISAGSSSTYYCDYLWNNSSRISYAIVGGSWYYGNPCGSRCINLSVSASDTSSGYGSRPSYIQ